MITYLGKSCSFDLPQVPFLNCRQFMYLVISLLVLRAWCGIWLHQFLIIAYLFTLWRILPQPSIRGTNSMSYTLTFARFLIRSPHKRLLVKNRKIRHQRKCLKMDKRVLKHQETACYSECGTFRMEKYNLWYTAVECARPNPVLNLHKWSAQSSEVFDLIKLFADDSKLYQIIKSNQDSDDLQIDVGKSKEWAVI